MKILVLSFEKKEECILHKILGDIQKRTKEYQIRSSIFDNEVLYRGDLIINPLCRTVKKNGEDIHLTAYEFDTLYLLAKKQGWVFSRQNIYSLIWKEPYNYSYGNVIHLISHLREKIEDDRFHPQYILTIRDKGYKFNPIFKNQIEE